MSYIPNRLTLNDQFTFTTMNKFAFTQPRTALAVLRISVALVFFVHAAVRIINYTIPQFSLFFQSKGFPYPTVLVWIITIFELAGSVLLALNLLTKWLSIGFFLLLLIGVILIHWSLGWFVGEHGTGGSEYSFILMVCLYYIWTHSTQKKTKAPDSLSLSAEDLTC